MYLQLQMLKGFNSPSHSNTCNTRVSHLVLIGLKSLLQCSFYVRSRLFLNILSY